MASADELAETLGMQRHPEGVATSRPSAGPTPAGMRQSATPLGVWTLVSCVVAPDFVGVDLGRVAS